MKSEFLELRRGMPKRNGSGGCWHLNRNIFVSATFGSKGRKSESRYMLKRPVGGERGE